MINNIVHCSRYIEAGMIEEAEHLLESLDTQDVCNIYLSTRKNFRQKINNIKLNQDNPYNNYKSLIR